MVRIEKVIDKYYLLHLTSKESNVSNYFDYLYSTYLPNHKRISNNKEIPKIIQALFESQRYEPKDLFVEEKRKQSEFLASFREILEYQDFKQNLNINFVTIIKAHEKTVLEEEENITVYAEDDIDVFCKVNNKTYMNIILEKPIKLYKEWF